ncbi:MAG: hypothetical protein AAF570_11695, partial [Bacteroidota bacterium]
ASLNNDSTLIRQYVETNHREWCLYERCLADAESRYFDMAAATIQTYQEAIDNGYWRDPSIPGSPGFNGTNNFDPWFNLKTTLWDTMVDFLTFDPYTSGAPSTGLLGYFDPATSPTLYQDCATQSCIDTLRWTYARGSYLDENLKMQVAYNIDSAGCSYYADQHTIVQKPALPTQASQNTADFNSFQVATECNDQCAGNVEIWLQTIKDSCALNTADETTIRAELLNFCLSDCQDGNPLGIITQADIQSGALSTVQTILNNDTTCAPQLDSIVTENPYTYTDQNGDSLKAECTVWDPCFVALVDLVNSSWNNGFPNSIPLPTILQNCYPTGAEIVIQNNEVILYDQMSQPIDTLLVLTDQSGTILNLNTLKFLQLPQYNNSAPTSGNYQNIELEAVFESGGNQNSQQAFVFATTNYSISQDSCLMPEITPDSSWTVSLNPDSLRDDCIQNLISQAEYEATQLYNEAVDAYLENVLQEQARLCFEFPYAENFTVRHLPKIYQYTLYYYDQAGNLVQTIPPEGVELLDSASTNRWLDGSANPQTDNPTHRMGTRYAFNSLGQLKKSNTPDGGETRIWYNDKDQIRLEQDARQLPNNQYAYIKYDELGRTTETGRIENYQGQVAESVLNSFAFPERSQETLTDIVTTTFDRTPNQNQTGLNQQNLRTRVAMTVRENAEGDTTALSLYDYDDHGNVTETRTELDGFGAFDLEYDYDLISGNVNSIRYQPGKADYFSHHYTYDADNRLTHVRTTSDDIFFDRDGRYFYYPHGPLARIELGEDNVQGMDYFYSIHGWIKGMNMVGTDNGQIDPGHDGDQSGTANEIFGQDASCFQLGF